MILINRLSQASVHELSKGRWICIFSSTLIFSLDFYYFSLGGYAIYLMVKRFFLIPELKSLQLSGCSILTKFQSAIQRRNKNSFPKAQEKNWKKYSSHLVRDNLLKVLVWKVVQVKRNQSVT